MSTEALHFKPQSEDEQQALGALLAQTLTKNPVIYLKGDLGAGKTTLVRGFLHGLGYQGKVKSPTYTLIEPYLIGERAVCHLDLYRLADADELEYLGIRDLLEEQAVLLIEWPEQGEGALPPADMRIHIEYREQGRLVSVFADSEIGAGLLQALMALTSES